ncbi:MAG: NAD+ synthase [Thermodesulfobacteriota bacterium]
MKQLRIALSQVNLKVGDISGNVKKIITIIKKAKKENVHILCFPELAVTGYPPEDLLLKPKFIDNNLKALEEIKKHTDSIVVLIGFVDRKDDIFNAAAVIQNKKIVDIYHKFYLPNYGVFDENRYFQTGRRIPVYKLDDITFGVNICEDIWYAGNPIKSQVLLGNAQLIINLSSSPYYIGKPGIREKMVATRARDYSSIIAFCNLVGGQDELVFDGNSFIVDERGDLLAKGKSFSEDMVICDLNTDKVFRSRLHDPRIRKNKYTLSFEENHVETVILDSLPAKKIPSLKTASIKESDEENEVLNALILGTRDYVRKNGFKKVVLGLSGGIDSSIVAAIASEAVGNKNVIGVSMPSMFSSKGSISDAELLSKNLGIKLFKIGIKESYDEFIKMLGPVFSSMKSDTAEENLQARIRGNILMALSNKFGWLVLTTGNKSEMSVGYSTLYGDMAGGFAVIKDVPKTMVYELVSYYNKIKKRLIIPKSVIDKAPSAELRPDQKDTDSLPPYNVLDRILKAYVEEDLSLDDIAAMGEDKTIVKRIIKMVDLNEYKRRQSPPGIKITSRAFGKDRRFPITNLYKE